MTVHSATTPERKDVAVDRASIDQLAYIRLSSPDIEGWAHLAHAVGMQVDVRGDGGVNLRLDDRSARVSIEPGRSSEVLALGWEVETPEQFSRVADQVGGAGVEVRNSPELAIQRGVCDVACFADPFGIQHELSWGPQPVIRSPFRSPTQTSFRTGTMGLGHATYSVPNFETAYSFYCGALGMRASDLATIGGNTIGFLRCNPRHHSLAVMQRTGTTTGVLRHIMVEVTTLDELGAVRDRCLDAQVPMSRDFGRHPTDGVVSIYLKTPDGFEFEIGWDSYEVDEATWHTQRANRLTRPWGHRTPLHQPSAIATTTPEAAQVHVGT